MLGVIPVSDTAVNSGDVGRFQPAFIWQLGASAAYLWRMLHSVPRPEMSPATPPGKGHKGNGALRESKFPHRGE